MSSLQLKGFGNRRGAKYCTLIVGECIASVVTEVIEKC